MNDDLVGIYVGFSQTLIGHPLDTLKIRIQNGNYHNMTSNLWAGLSVPLLSSVSINALSFYLFNKTKQLCSNYSNEVEINYVSGFVSGVLSSVVIHPIEYFKIRKQCSKNFSFDLKTIYSGVYCTLVRESIGASVYFGVYYQTITQYNAFIAGGFAGMFSWLVTYPIDVVRTRIALGDGKIDYKKAISKGNLFNGLNVCMLRSFIVNGFSFTVYDYLREKN